MNLLFQTDLEILVTVFNVEEQNDTEDEQLIEQDGVEPPKKPPLSGWSIIDADGKNLRNSLHQMSQKLEKSLLQSNKQKYIIDFFKKL